MGFLSTYDDITVSRTPFVFTTKLGSGWYKGLQYIVSILHWIVSINFEIPDFYTVQQCQIDVNNSGVLHKRNMSFSIKRATGVAVACLSEKIMTIHWRNHKQNEYIDFSDFCLQHILQLPTWQLLVVAKNKMIKIK